MSATFVIFGASGDLTSRKLIPSLFQLHRKKRLPADTRIVGFCAATSPTKSGGSSWPRPRPTSWEPIFSRAAWDTFAKNVHYYAGDLGQQADVAALSEFLDQLRKPRRPAPAAAGAGGEQNNNRPQRIYYLADCAALLRIRASRARRLRHGRSDARHSTHRHREAVGTDLDDGPQCSNDAVHRVFTENQVYRIDHYLGKETVQNILVFPLCELDLRAALEPQLYRSRADHGRRRSALVGRRGELLRTAGVLRDMFQNHLLQLLTVTAMEVPARFDADLVRNEKVKVAPVGSALTPPRTWPMPRSADNTMVSPGRRGRRPTARQPRSPPRLHIDNRAGKECRFTCAAAKR